MNEKWTCIEDSIVNFENNKDEILKFSSMEKQVTGKGSDIRKALIF